MHVLPSVAHTFSPAVTLTQRTKLVMMADAMISFLTIAFVAARAMNILA